MSLSYKEVAEILKIIDASNCEEVILEFEGTRLVVRKGDRLVSENTTNTVLDTSPSPRPEPIKNMEAELPNATEGPETSNEEKSGTIVRSPMVGTFYRAPSPDEPPFVENGAKVNSGDPLCLIEVMKLYTTVEATMAGTITAISANDGTLVEFDQPLFTIAPI